MPKLLLIEDDKETADEITAELGDRGFDVSWAADGIEGLAKARSGGADVMVIDRLLPGMDGLTIIETLRGEGNRTPVLVLSALGAIDERVRGLRSGGDDYLTKPFALSELLARANAIIRRQNHFEDTSAQTRLRVGELEIDLLSRTVSRASREIDLQHQEFKLLEYLLRNAGRVVTRTMLLEKVWDLNFDPGTNVVESHMSRLRSKVDRGFATEMIRTIRGAGYVLSAD